MFNKQTKTANRTIFSVVLVIAETLVALLLRFDKPLKSRLTPLVQKDLVVCVRTYLPHYCFYISFDEKGVLFDNNLPNDVEKEDILISGSTLSVVKVLLTEDEKLLRKLQFRGDDTHVELLKGCIENIGLQNVLGDIFTNLKELTPDEQERKTKQINQFKETLTHQETEIANLSSSLAASQSQLINSQKQIKILYGILVLLFVAVIALLLFLFG